MLVTSSHALSHKCHSTHKKYSERLNPNNLDTRGDIATRSWGEKTGIVVALLLLTAVQPHVLARLLPLHQFSMIIDSSSFAWLGIFLKDREDDAQASTGHLDHCCEHKYPHDSCRCDGECWSSCSYLAPTKGSLGTLGTHWTVSHRVFPLASVAGYCFQPIGSRRRRKPPDHAGPSPEHMDY